MSEFRSKVPFGVRIINGSPNGNALNSDGEVEAKRRAILIEWINSIIPNFSLPLRASDEELRSCLSDGMVLCRILNKLKPGSVNEAGDSENFSVSSSENVRRFLAAMDELGLPRFESSDLEKGSMKVVIDCLLTLRGKFIVVGVAGDNSSVSSTISRSGSAQWDSASRSSTMSLEEKQKAMLESKFQSGMRNSFPSEPSAALMHATGHKFHEVFQLKQGRYADLPAAKISEMMKSNSLDNAPTQSLLSVVNGILDESVERKSGEIPHRVACLLRKVVQEIERRISTQAEHLRTQNNLFKSREEKYQSRIRVLEALAAGVTEEAQIAMQQFQQVKTVENCKAEENKKLEEDIIRLTKERDQYNQEIASLKQELVNAKKSNGADYSLEISALKQELENAKKLSGDQYNLELSALKQELENAKKFSGEQNNLEILALKQELENAKKLSGETNNLEISELRQELEKAKKSYEFLRSTKIETETETKLSNAKLETKVKDLESLLADSSSKVKELESLSGDSGAKLNSLESLLKDSKAKVTSLETLLADSSTKVKSLESLLADSSTKVKSLETLLEDSNSKVKNLETLLEDSSTRVKTLESLLADASTKVKEIEAHSESKLRSWKQKTESCKSKMDIQIVSLKGVRLSFDFIRQELRKTQQSYSDDFNVLGRKLKALSEAAESHDVVLAENRKMFNELQELKGNIRVYCRVRPFLPGQAAKRTIVEKIDDNGELVVANPAKPGREGQKAFKFNKIYGPSASQADVFLDTKPLIRSVLDGYNVCIFAYGQTGSGKTYTMTGPNNAKEEDWGVNYRALNDLFKISQSRQRVFAYEVSVQMVEIYNELVRDLLSKSNDPASKKLGILSTTQANGLAVPDATMRPVTSTNDVMDLMNIGLKNRAVSATALNERSSRSHSVVTIHVRAKELKTGTYMYGNLHLVDLAGSERVDRSEVTGDRLREAQHINKSLSALGDVIFALAQKSSHVPYRNSKLTQILQSSLGGHAKTLMFVQLNPDIASYSESLSTLKFAERVSGIELGAAKSSKEGRDVKDLMDQVASLKDTIAKKDDEIERLHLLKDCKSPPPVSSERRGAGSSRYESSSKNRELCNEADSQQSMDDSKFENVNPLRQQSNVAGEKIRHTDAEALGIGALGFGDGDSKERLSDISDSTTVSVGTDPERALSPGQTKPSIRTDRSKSVSKVRQPTPGLARTASTIVLPTRDIPKGSPSTKKTGNVKSSTIVKPPRPWQ